MAKARYCPSTLTSSIPSRSAKYRVGTPTAATNSIVQDAHRRLYQCRAKVTRLAWGAKLSAAPDSVARSASDIGESPLRREQARRPPLDEDHHGDEDQDLGP